MSAICSYIIFKRLCPTHHHKGSSIDVRGCQSFDKKILNYSTSDNTISISIRRTAVFFRFLQEYNFTIEVHWSQNNLFHSISYFNLMYMTWLSKGMGVSMRWKYGFKFNWGNLVTFWCKLCACQSCHINTPLPHFWQGRISYTCSIICKN